MLWATSHILDVRRELFRRLALKAVAEGETNQASILEDHIALVERRTALPRRTHDLHL